MKIKNVYNLTNDEIIFYCSQRIMTLRSIERKKLNFIPAIYNLNNKVFSNIKEYEDRRNANLSAAAHNSRLTTKKKRIVEKISHYQKLLNEVLPPYIWIKINIKERFYFVGRNTNDWHNSLGELYIKEQKDILPKLEHIIIN